MHDNPKPAPALQTSQWFNVDTPIELENLRGQVVVIEAFQMLCPGCVSNGLPQAMRVHDAFGEGMVKVLGLHTVFEHHQAMPPESLEAFLYEYKINFPVGVDQAGTGVAIPKTMAAYQMQGTPTLILIDKLGRRRAQHFGHVSDLQLGAEIMSLHLENEKQI